MESTIKSFLGIDKLNKLKQEQLDLQERLDSKLQLLECKDTVINFLFYQRKLCRELQLKSMNMSLIEMSKGLENEIKQSINIYTKAINILETDINDCQKCYKIRRII